MTGTVYTIAPIPPDPEHTTWIEAGNLRIGVEYRLLNDAELAANYHGEDMAQIQAATGGEAVEDNGVSLHVCGSEDGHEYLRFDMFAREPHYHYIEPTGKKQTIVEYDRVAMGEMLPWTLNQLRIRLQPMISYAGGVELAKQLDQAEVNKALGDVERLARDAETALQAQLNQT